MKSFKEKINEVVTTSAIPPVSGPPPKADGTAMGYPYFKCPNDIFSRCIKGRKKRERWTKFMGDNEFTEKVKTWAKENKKTKFLLKDDKSNSYIFVNRFM